MAAPTARPIREVKAGVQIDAGALAGVLLALPALYFCIAYAYLAAWHGKLFLWNTIIHENGRLTLLESLLYFDHFIGVVPMIALFALCTAGGFLLRREFPPLVHPARSRAAAAALAGSGVFLVVLAFAGSVQKAGWQRTLDYALQRIERDGILSHGGTWHQLQLSNFPIAFGAIALSISLVLVSGCRSQRRGRTLLWGSICLAAAAGLSLCITLANWNGWQAYLNPRWMAHSVREMATHPVTGIPVAWASVLLVERYLSGARAWTLRVSAWSVMLLGASVLIAFAQLVLLQNANVLALAQKPPFAPGGLSVAYLLCAHVMEHFLDFILMGLWTAGIYAGLRFLGRDSC